MLTRVLLQMIQAPKFMPQAFEFGGSEFRGSEREEACRCPVVKEPSHADDLEV